MVKRLPIVKIRLRILSFLRKMPMSTYDASMAVSVSYKAVVVNLSYLEKLGKIERYRIEALDKTLWRIKPQHSLKASE